MVAWLRGSVNCQVNEVFPIERSNLYQRWLAEHEAIAVHKWLVSEQMGHDCGWEYARWDWNMRFRADWLKSLTEASKPTPSSEGLVGGTLRASGGNVGG